MRLFIWTEVYYDYGPGMAVAIAETEGDAILLIANMHACGDYDIQQLTETHPEVIDLGRKKIKPRAWYVTGGG